MSWTISVDVKACEHCGRSEYDAADFNHTHNLDPALRKAGVDFWQFRDKTAAECEPILTAGIETIRANRAEYEKLNPENGWGSIETMLPELEKLRDAMRKHPTAIVRVRG